MVFTESKLHFFWPSGHNYNKVHKMWQSVVIENNIDESKFFGTLVQGKLIPNIFGNVLFLKQIDHTQPLKILVVTSHLKQATENCFIIFI